MNPKLVAGVENFQAQTRMSLSISSDWGPGKTHMKLALDAECLYFLLKLDALALFYETNG